MLVGVFERSDSPVLTPAGRQLDVQLGGELGEHLRRSYFDGSFASMETVCFAEPGRGARYVVLVGLGTRERLDTQRLRTLSALAVRRLDRWPAVASILHDALEGDDAQAASCEGLRLGTYRFTGKPADDAGPRRIVIVDASVHALRGADVMSGAAGLVRDLVNQPASVCCPLDLARAAVHALQQCPDVTVTIAEQEELSARGFGAILAVGRGSAQRPCLTTIEYHPPRSTIHVALVGKGVTFDAGGITPKSVLGMQGMKTDMAGAATVIGVVQAAALLRLPLHLTGILPAAENMPDGNSYRPGDVITHYGGRTTEIIDPDAEGRLLLADGIAFAAELNPDVIVDLGTLTSIISMALGPKAFGIFSNRKQLGDQIESAAGLAGERAWQLPLLDVYRGELISDFADSINCARTANGGAISAALFLEQFVPADTAWAHLDIAGAARAESPFEEYTRGATAVPIRTIVRWCQQQAGGPA
ncbi:MAG: leucyl aminopeptidase family protein [Streptosporangiaceae bacterium]